jgi:hypothetical protein
MTPEELYQRKLALEQELQDIEANLSKLPKAPAWRMYKQGILQVSAVLKDNIWHVTETFELVRVCKELSEQEFEAYKTKVKQLYFDLG